MSFLRLIENFHCGSEHCSYFVTSLLQAGLVVVVELCSIFVRLIQVQCLRSGHKTCKRKVQVFRPTLSHGTC